MLFLEKLEQKKVYIILVILICILVGTLYAVFFMPKKYVSSSSMMLMKTEANMENNGNVELNPNLISTFEELIKSDSSINETKKNINLNSEISRKNISVERVSNSDTFQISVKSLNSDDAVNMNYEIINTFSNKINSMYKNTKLYIVDNAHIVNSGKTSTIIIFVIISAFIGIVIDVIYVVCLMKFEKNIRNAKDVESNFSLKTIGLIPLKKSKNAKLICSEVEKTRTNIEFKKLRSNIQFLNVNNKSKNIILITSCSEEEGKSYVASNLAVSYANVGKKVVLVDADLNLGNQAQIFNLPNNMGLSNFLSNLDETGMEINERVNSFIKETNIKNLNIITSGTVPPNSSELLSTPKLPEMLKDLSVFYDVIVIDGTKILNKLDSLILSRYATSVAIVAVEKKTQKDDLWKTKRDIQNVGGRIIGIVLNKVKINEEKEEKTSYKVLESLKEKIKYYVQKLKENKKQKLLNEAKEHSESSEYIEIQNEEKILNNAIIDEKKEVLQENTDTAKNEKTDTSEQADETVEENKIEENEASEETKEAENIVIVNNINAEKTEISNNEKIEKMKLTIKAGYSLVRKFARRTIRKCKLGVAKIYKKAMLKLKNNNIEEENKKAELKTENNLVDDNKIPEKEDNNVETKISKKQSEDTVLVVVDALNEVCRAFSKTCFIEKLVRGLDTTDGFIKAHYSSYLLRKRREALILMYSLTKKQAGRIDPLIYSTLIDYDDYVWIDKKVTSNKAEDYVLCMTKDYDKIEGEKTKNYIQRCKNLRKEALYNCEIEIEYSIDLLWKSSKMKFSDKVMMNKFAKIYGENDLTQNSLEDSYASNYSDEDLPEKNLEESKKQVSTKKDVLKKINPIRKIAEVKNNIVKVEQVKAKSAKEIAEEVENELNEKNSNIDLNQYNVNSNFSELMINEQDENFDYEMQKIERKKETEVLKKIQKEKNSKRKKEEKVRKQKEREEKNRQREQLRREKELEREKKIEEARIEEELLVDNLYPKTKNNKNL